MATRCSTCGWQGITDTAPCPDCGQFAHEDLVAQVEREAAEFHALMARLERGEKPSPAPAEVYFRRADELPAQPRPPRARRGPAHPDDEEAGGLVP